MPHKPSLQHFLQLCYVAWVEVIKMCRLCLQQVDCIMWWEEDFGGRSGFDSQLFHFPRVHLWEV